ncbi:MAG TPA: hypothetical protein VHG93_22210 [Longimicrobium sp.]|nr:hypothetical protein [Longimicrobium sp.]
MGGNKIVYKEAYERALAGKGPSLLQRLMSPFQDHYTQASRLQGERDGAAARAAAGAASHDGAAAATAQN